MNEDSFKKMAREGAALRASAADGKGVTEKGAPASAVADVVVVGGGGSGLAASIEAASAGASVLLLEKNPATGGSTGWSIGSITASGTPDQQRAGIVDDPQQHFEDMGRCAGALAPRDNLELRRLLTANVTDTVAWLRGHGIAFFGPLPEAPHRYPRMHNVLPTSRSYVYNLTRAARRAGVDIRLGMRATRILLEGRRAVGIEAIDKDGRRVAFRSRRAVVLAGGDYSGGHAFKLRYGSPEIAAVGAVNETNTGDCQQMVLDIGGEVINGDLILGPVMRFVRPPRRNLIQRIPPWPPLARTMAWMLHHLPGALSRPFVMRFMTTVMGPQPELFADGVLLVDREGRKIDPIAGNYGRAVTAAPDGLAWLILDSSLVERYSQAPHAVSTAPGIAWAYFPDYARTRPDLHRSAATVAALGQALCMPPAQLVATVMAHGRSGPRTFDRGPYHSLGPIRGYVVLTDGGVRVSAELKVIVDGGQEVEGLFAAGSTGQGGLLLEGHGHHLGWAFTSGRIAGRNAARSPAQPMTATTRPSAAASSVHDTAR